MYLLNTPSSLPPTNAEGLRANRSNAVIAAFPFSVSAEAKSGLSFSIFKAFPAFFYTKNKNCKLKKKKKKKKRSWTEFFFFFFSKEKILRRNILNIFVMRDILDKALHNHIRKKSNISF
jgi:hypothetical protein